MPEKKKYSHIENVSQVKADILEIMTYQYAGKQDIDITIDYEGGFLP